MPWLPGHPIADQLSSSAPFIWPSSHDFIRLFLCLLFPERRAHIARGRWQKVRQSASEFVDYNSGLMEQNNLFLILRNPTRAILSANCTIISTQDWLMSLYFKRIVTLIVLTLKRSKGYSNIIGKEVNMESPNGCTKNYIFNETCNYFSHDGTNCFFIFAFEWTQPTEDIRNG